MRREDEEGRKLTLLELTMDAYTDAMLEELTTRPPRGMYWTTNTTVSDNVLTLAKLQEAIAEMSAQAHPHP